jgi:hypothetical protein
VSPEPGVTIGKEGNTYDAEPPFAGRSLQAGRPPVGFQKAPNFLQERLAAADRTPIDLVNEWVDSGGPKTTLFNAKKRMVNESTLIVDESQKPQTWRLNAAGYAGPY